MSDFWKAFWIGYFTGIGATVVFIFGALAVLRAPMSCNDCSREQETLKKAYFYRIGNGNVLVFGCRRHVTEMFDRLRKEQKEVLTNYEMGLEKRIPRGPE